MNYPSKETAWKSDAYALSQMLLSPNGDNGWSAVRSYPDIPLAQFSGVYFCSYSPGLAARSQLQNQKNISGLLHKCGLYMVRTMQRLVK